MRIWTRVKAGGLACLLLCCPLLSADTAAREPEVAISVVAEGGGAARARLSIATRAGLRYELRDSGDLRRWEVTGEEWVGDGSLRHLPASLLAEGRFYQTRARLAESILSAATGIEYPFHVYLPEGYEQSSRAYPIIYATDGQWNAEGFGGAIRRSGKQVILVAIEQGPGDRRAIDYTMPGAPSYFDFLVTELVPAVESVLRVDPRRRALCGTSYGGLFAGLALLMDDPQAPVFSAILSFDGSFYHRQYALRALEQERFESGYDLRVTLFLSNAKPPRSNDRHVTSFQSLLESRGYSGLTIHRRSYDTTHEQVAQPSFEEALELLY